MNLVRYTRRVPFLKLSLALEALSSNIGTLMNENRCQFDSPTSQWRSFTCKLFGSYPKCLITDFGYGIERKRHFSKKAKKSNSKGAIDVSEDDSDTLTFDTMKTMMQKSLDHYAIELSNIRTGRATPGMLDHIAVEDGGTKLPLSAMATVSVRDPQLLVVMVFNPEKINVIAKAIESSPLNLSPKVDKSEILVPLPKATKEGLEALVKVATREAEKAKVSVRHARKSGMEEAKEVPGKDERKKAEKSVDSITNSFIDKIDKLKEAKEKEILSG